MTELDGNLMVKCMQKYDRFWFNVEAVLLSPNYKISHLKIVFKKAIRE